MLPCSYSVCGGTIHNNTNLGIERYIHYCTLPEDVPLVGEAVLYHGKRCESESQLPCQLTT